MFRENHVTVKALKEELDKYSDEYLVELGTCCTSPYISVGPEESVINPPFNAVKYHDFSNPNVYLIWDLCD